MFFAIALLVAGTGLFAWLLRSRTRPNSRFMESNLAVSLIIVGIMSMMMFGIGLLLKSLTD